MKERLLWMATGLFIAASPGAADEGGGTHGYAWARNPQGARAVAMGGAYSALVSGPMSSFWNPAGHAITDHSSFDAGYRQAFAGVHSGYLAASWLRGSGSVAVAMGYMSFGSIDVVDSAGESDPGGARFTPAMGSISAGYGWDITEDGLHGGVQSRLYYQSIDEASSVAIGVDLGLSWRGNMGSAAFVLRNVGTEVSAFRETSEALPLVIAMGFAWHPTTVPLVASIEVEDPSEGSLLVHAGVETWVGDIIALRGGFDSRYRDQASEAEPIDGLSVGFGTGIGTGLEVSYAASFQGELGLGHRLSINHRFD